MRISAKLAAVIDGNNTLSGKELWDLLASQELIPAISDKVPNTASVVYWGYLDDGVFFVSDFTATENGLICQVSLSPANKVGREMIMEWIWTNLFQNHPGTLYPVGEDWRLMVRGRPVTFAIENLIAIDSVWL